MLSSCTSTFSLSAPARMLTCFASSSDDKSHGRCSPAKRVCKTDQKRSNEFHGNKSTKTRSVLDTLLGYQKEDIERLKARSRELNNMLLEISESRLDELLQSVSESIHDDTTLSPSDCVEEEDVREEEVPRVASTVKPSSSSSSTNLDDFDEFIDAGIKGLLETHRPR